MFAPVTDVPTALLTGLAAGLVTLTSALPGIIAALAILVLGWIVTGVLARVVARALRAVHIDAAAERSGVSAIIRRAQITAGVAGLISGAVKWYLRLLVVVMAADAVSLHAIGTLVSELIAFVPNLVVAVAILGAFSWLAARARTLVTSALEPTLPYARTIGVLAYSAAFGFGVIAAATQIGVATALIDILFAGIVAGLALAFGLAFGLGGRDEAAQMFRSFRTTADATTPVARPTAATLRPDVVGNGRPHAEAELSKA